MTEGRDWWLLPRGRNQVLRTFYMRSERGRVRVQTRAWRRATVAQLATQNRADTPPGRRRYPGPVIESCLLNVTFDICARSDVMSPGKELNRGL